MIRCLLRSSAAALLLLTAYLTAACGDETAQVGVIEPLLLVASSPSDTSTAVAVDAVVTATFSGSVDEATLTTESFWLRDAGGNAVSASLSYDDPTLTATLAPDAELAYSAAYTVGLTNAIESQDGRELGNDQELGFVTEDPPPLRLLSASPQDGAADVPADATLTFIFSEAVAAGTVTATSLQVTDTAAGGGAISGAIAVSGATITFSPDTALAYSSVLEIVLDATIASARATPQGGQLEGAPITLTAGVVRPPPLFVVASQPPDGSDGYPVDQPLIVIFSEPLDAASVASGTTLALSSASTAIALNPTTPFEIDGEILTVWPAAADAFTGNLLAYDTDYTLTLGSALQSVVADPARSTQGTLESDVVIDFATAPPPPLELLLVSPANNAAQVGLNTRVDLVFSEPVALTTFEAIGAVILTGDAAALTLSFSQSGTTVTVGHPLLERATTYTLELANTLASVRGGTLVATAAIAPACPGDASKRCVVFATVPFEPLRIERVFPANLAIGVEPSLDPLGDIVIEFSADVEPDTLCPASWDPTAGSCSDPANLFINEGRDSDYANRLMGGVLNYTNDAGAFVPSGGLGPYVARWTPLLELNQNTDHTITVRADVAPTDGLVPPLAADFYSRFRTRISSRLLAVLPDDGSCVVVNEEASTASVIELLFTEDVDPSSVSFGPSGTIQITYTDTFGITRYLDANLTQSGVDPATLDPSMDFSSNLLTIAPVPTAYDCLDGVHALVPDAHYDVVITLALQRAAGGPMFEVNQTTEFCTAGPMVFGQASADNGLVSAAPLQTAETIPVNSGITLTFDRPVDLDTAVADGTVGASMLIELIAVEAGEADNNLAKCATGALETVPVVTSPDDANAILIQPPVDFYCYGAQYRLTVRGGVAAGAPPGVTGNDGVELANDVTVTFATDPGNRERVSDPQFPPVQIFGDCLSSLVQTCNVEVLFERPILPGSVTRETAYIWHLDSDYSLELLPVVSPDARLVTLVPNPELAEDSHLLLMLTRGLKDFRGNPFPERADRCLGTELPPESGFAARFDTRGGQLFGKPCWGGSDPVDAGTADRGSVRPVITLTNVDPPNGMLIASITCQSVILREQGTTENLCHQILFNPGDCVSGCSFEVWPDPTTMLDHGLTYEVVVGNTVDGADRIVDSTLIGLGEGPGCGTPGGARTITFTVDDGHAGGVYIPGATPSLSPAGPADVPVTTEAITLTFDMDLRPASVTGSTFTVDSGGMPLTGRLEVIGVGDCNGSPCVSNVIRYDLAGSLPGPAATVQVSALVGGTDCDDSICDAAGHLLNAATVASFTTNGTAPSVGGITTSAGSLVDVPTDAEVVITFTAVDPIDPSTIRCSDIGGTGNVRLVADPTGAETELYGCSVVAGADGREIHVRPVDPLPATSTIGVRVGSTGNCGAPAVDIADVAGNALTGCDETTTFTTGN